jgi:endoglucanase
VIPEDHAFAVLEAVAGVPTAPLHEAAVARHLARALRALGLPVWQDRYGNLFARYRHGHGARPLALVAHMDHPGLAVTQASNREVTADVLGGFPGSVLAPGTAFRVHDGEGSTVGRVLRYLPGAGQMRPAVRLAMRAADDLAQCACLLLVAERVAAVDEPADVTWLFTRAEELGLIGATLVAQELALPLNTIVVSLECSKALPGAEIGQGPVIRVGDAVQSFHPEGEALLLAAREQLQPGAPRGQEEGARVQVQRQLMSGGGCEATAFRAYGYVTTGMVFPLGNYHNADSNGQLAPEYIHLRDFLGGVDLVLAAIAEAAHLASTLRWRLSRRAERLSSRLASTARAWQLAVPLAPPATE